MGLSPVLHRTPVALLCAVAASVFSHAYAADPDAIGLSALRREQPALTGAGIPVAQSEAPVDANTAWEVNPSYAAQPASFFTWQSASGTASTYPNSVGTESPHADAVAAVFYGAIAGVAPGVSHVRNYEANYYIESIIALGVAEPEMVANNSWVAGIDSNLDTLFDNAAATRNILFVSGMNNAADTPQSPGSCYNGIGVGGMNGTSSVGPTSDGRCKPDIVVPGPELTSFLTPAVSGAAALLLQAGARNDGGPGTASLATNSITTKALLLNGAVKPPGWTNGPTRPLDARWGAGALNVYNSWLQLRGGRAAYIASSTAPLNGAHPPTASAANIATLRGWDRNSVSSLVNSDGINHYYFSLPAGGTYTVNLTLVWKRASGASSAQNLDLFLYNLAATNLVASSVSAVDNVEHIFVTNVPGGRYDLQVLKHGGIGSMGAETYALAWDFHSPRLSITRRGADVVLSWPINEAGLFLQNAADTSSPVWQYVNAAPFVTNGQNTVTLPVTGSFQTFRLHRP